MTQEEIIELWKKANGWNVKDFQNTLDDLMRFAKLVAEKEREACAKIADEWVAAYPHPSQSIAERIRKRGEV
jgi:hypothetical protein